MDASRTYWEMVKRFFFFTWSRTSRRGCWFLWRRGHWCEDEIFIIYDSTWSDVLTYNSESINRFFRTLNAWFDSRMQTSWLSYWPGLSSSPPRASAKSKPWHETLGEEMKKKTWIRHFANVKAKFVLVWQCMWATNYIHAFHTCQVFQWSKKKNRIERSLLPVH